MTEGRTGRLAAEIADAGRGLFRLMRFDPTWDQAFDLSGDGFMRSFLAPLLSLPLNLLTIEAVNRGRADAAAAALAPGSLAAATLAQLVDALGYPLLIGLLARPAGIERGYAAFVTVANWGSLFLNLAIAAAALPMLALGPAAAAPFSLVALVCLCASLLMLWRAGRETLSREVAPVLMVVVLSVGVDALAGQVARALS